MPNDLGPKELEKSGEGGSRAATGLSAELVPSVHSPTLCMHAPAGSDGWASCCCSVLASALYSSACGHWLRNKAYAVASPLCTCACLLNLLGSCLVAAAFAFWPVLSVQLASSPVPCPYCRVAPSPRQANNRSSWGPDHLPCIHALPPASSNNLLAHGTKLA